MLGDRRRPVFVKLVKFLVRMMTAVELGRGNLREETKGLSIYIPEIEYPQEVYRI